MHDYESRKLYEVVSVLDTFRDVNTIFICHLQDQRNLKIYNKLNYVVAYLNKVNVQRNKF